MSEQTGAWLRRERESRGWDRPEMARQLIAAARSRGAGQMPGVKSLTHNIYRWEGGDGVSQRYMLAYCAAFGIEPADFPRRASSRRSSVMPADPVLSADPGLSANLASSRAAGIVAARGTPAGDPDSTIEEQIADAAHEASERAWQAEQRGIGDTTLEQLRADVTRLSRDYMTAEPVPLFKEMARVRRRMHEALDLQLWPRDKTELYFLLGSVNGLMGCVAADLGYPAAGEELGRAGWAFATVIGHRGLMAKLRLDLAGLCFWDGQVKRAADLASSGLGYLSGGPTAVQLHVRYGRAAARMGDIAAARRSIEAARRAHELDYDDDLTAIGGEFDLSLASAQYLIGSVLIDIPGASTEAVAQLEQAVELYGIGPGPFETHGYGTAALASISLAEAWLGAGTLDGAAAALDRVLDLPPSRRIDPIPQGLARVRAGLTRDAYRRSPLARDLAEQIDAFGGETAGNENDYFIAR
jgi:tetratricopeptide (TPR) repeat protein